MLSAGKVAGTARNAVAEDSTVFVGIDGAKLKHAVAEPGRNGRGRYMGEVEASPDGVRTLIFADVHRRPPCGAEQITNGYKIPSFVGAVFSTPARWVIRGISTSIAKNHESVNNEVYRCRNCLLWF